MRNWLVVGRRVGRRDARASRPPTVDRTPGQRATTARVSRNNRSHAAYHHDSALCVSDLRKTY